MISPSLTLPKWVEEHLLSTRGIEICMTVRHGKVYVGSVSGNPLYVVKLLEADRVEAATYARLLERVQHHVIQPAELLRTPRGAILLMPILEVHLARPPPWTLDILLDVAVEILEGVEHLHDMHIAHMDIHDGNILFTPSPFTYRYPDGFPAIPPGRVYLIDFETAVWLPEGPGKQGPVELKESVIRAPRSMKKFDPYAWDMWCVGLVLRNTVKFMELTYPLRWFVGRFVQWVIGSERGCTGVCRCRSSARTARRVAVCAQSLLAGWRYISNAYTRCRSMIFTA